MISSSQYCVHCGAANPARQTICFACQQPLAQQPADTENVRLLHERYRILTQVGAGGFGAVYKSIDTHFSNRLVAVKQTNLHVLTPQQAIEATAAFHREVELLSTLDHPQLPHIHDHFTDPEHWYLVMDFLEGETLERYLHESENASTQGDTRSLPMDEVIAIGLQLCTVLEYLHTRTPPIVFRDLKPANVMRAADGHLSLIDFGIARHFKPGQHKDTIPFGSPGYAAPEQYGKAQTTPRADIYSLGVLLHQLLSGDDPAETPLQFTPLRAYAGPGFTELEALITRMVEIDASKRPGSMSEVQGELRRIKELLAGPGVRIWRPSPSSSFLPNSHSQSWYIPSSSQGAMQVQQQVQRTHAGSSRRTFLKRTLLAGTLLALGGGGIAAYLQHNGSALPLFGFNFGWQVQVINYDTLTALCEFSWSPDGKHIALALEDYTVQIWDVSSGKQVFVYPGHKSIVYAVAWSPDGKHLASASMDKTVQVWEAGTGKRIFTYRGHSDGVTGVAWSPDGKHLASASMDKTVQVWHVGNRHAHLTYHGLYDSGTIPLQPWVTWSPNGKHIATGNYGATLEVWDANNGKPVFTYKGTPDVSVSDGIAWSPDGSTIAIGVQDVRADMTPVEGAVRDEVQIWRVADGKRVLTLQGDASPDSSSGSIAWSPDGTRIAVACYKGKVQVWDARSGILIGTYTGQRGEVHAVAWSPDSRLIASVAYGGPIIIWRA